MTRPLAGLANDLRMIADSTAMNDDLQSYTDLNRQAADVLDMLAQHLPPPACDMCSKPHPHEGCDYNAMTFNGNWLCEKCGYVNFCPSPHCDNGRLAWDEWLQRVGDVWAAVQGEDYDSAVPYPGELAARSVKAELQAFDAGSEAVIDYLRQVVRQP